jgi:hypothetical protein
VEDGRRFGVWGEDEDGNPCFDLHPDAVHCDAWGYALHDSERAWRCLMKQTLAAHARAYPGLCYGIWSGPDSWNSHLGERVGETFVQPATPMREFPVMNSSAHAGPLLALFKVLGVETTADGVRVDGRAPVAAGAWRLRTPQLDLRPPVI